MIKIVSFPLNFFYIILRYVNLYIFIFFSIETSSTSIDVRNSDSAPGWVRCKFILNGEHHLGHRFYVTGSRHELGGWDMSKAVPLTYGRCKVTGETYKMAEIDMPSRIKSFTFRMIGVDRNGRLVSITSYDEGNTIPGQQHVYTQSSLKPFVP